MILQNKRLLYVFHDSLGAPSLTKIQVCALVLRATLVIIQYTMYWLTYQHTLINLICTYQLKAGPFFYGYYITNFSWKSTLSLYKEKNWHKNAFIKWTIHTSFSDAQKIFLQNQVSYLIVYFDGIGCGGPEKPCPGLCSNLVNLINFWPLFFQHSRISKQNVFG